MFPLRSNSTNRTFTKSGNSVPKMSHIPTCFYGPEALTYWNTPDYAIEQVYTSTSRQMHAEELGLPKHDFYRYPKVFSIVRYLYQSATIITS